HIPKGGGILAPNHVSYYDPPIVAISCPDEVYFLAKKFLFRTPLLGWLIRHLNTYPLSGNIRDLSSIKTIGNLLEQEKKVVIFPEGVRTPDGKLARVKPGIAMLSLRTNVPIIPTYIHGTYEVWPCHRWVPKPWGKTVCIFGSPIYPDSFKDLDPKEAKKEIATAVHDSLADLSKTFKRMFIEAI
ncbi:MAG: lysophospholipid acyltransferase family protein, partial [Waddliaceae bacterium]